MGIGQYGEHLLEYLGGNSKEWPCNSVGLATCMHMISTTETITLVRLIFLCSQLCQMLRRAAIIIGTL